MITEEMHNEKKCYVYESPDLAKQRELYDDLLHCFENYAEEEGIDCSKVTFDFRLFNEINIRVDKRKDYYIIFHKIHISEIRQTALIAFWILKFKPFLVNPENTQEYNVNINCGFAIYILLSAVAEYIEGVYKGKKKLFVSKEYLENLEYAFKFWDLSKESVMLIAETLCMCIEDKE